MGQAYQQAGQARASGYLGMGNTMQNALGNYQMMNALQQPQPQTYGGGGYTGWTDPNTGRMF
jgi:hypothetical protein